MSVRKKVCTMTTDEPTPAKTPGFPDDLISSVIAAKLLSVSTMTVRRWISDGTLPAYRMGKLFKVRRSDVSAFIEASRVIHTPPTA